MPGGSEIPAIPVASASGSGGMMGPCIGTMEPFIPETGSDFDEYLERMGHFFALNGIENDRKKCSAFITLAGQVCLKKLKAAIQPAVVTSKSYKEITEVLKNIFSPRRSLVAERFQFYERRQKEDETVSEFANELQMLAQTCKFGAFLMDALRDKFVCGVRDGHMQARLLDEDKTFEESLKKAVGMELAKKNVELMKPTTSTVGKIGQKSSRDPKGSARRQEKPPSRDTWNRSKERDNKSSEKRDKSKKRSKSPIKCFRCGKWSHHIAAECRERKKSKRDNRHDV